MTAAKAPRPVPPSWLRAVGEANAAPALPLAGLTLLELGSVDGKRHGHWPTAVVSLTLDLLQCGQPVFYVESGGFGGGASGQHLAAAAANDPHLMVHNDDDLVVYTPVIKGAPGPLTGSVTVDGRLLYSCYVPTLRNIERDLQEHDTACGTSVVIFDEVEMIRPYWDVTDEGGDPPLRLPEPQADGWRATDLVAFAEARPAPTLLVSHWPDKFTGRRALLDVSLAHAVVLRAAGGSTVDVFFTRRASLLAPWPRPRVTRAAIHDH